MSFVHIDRSARTSAQPLIRVKLELEGTAALRVEVQASANGMDWATTETTRLHLPESRKGRS